MMAEATLNTNRDETSSAEDELNKYRFGKTFPEITRADTFVDKTIFIPRFTKKKLCIVAPRGFGKSVNLDMMKCFLELQCDKVTGEQIPRDDERSNYKLFEGLNIMQPEYADFVEHNFGKFAVLKVDFLCCDSVDNVEEAINFLKKVIHNTYKEYQYLQRSDRLDGNDRALCTKWCSENYHSVVDTQDIKVGLGFLAQLLYEYFLTKVFVLIDDYDSLIVKIWLNSKITCQDYDYIKSLYCDVLSSVLSRNFVEGKLVTAVFHIVYYGFMKPFDYFSFGCLKPICGFTSDEAVELFNKFNLSEEEKYIANEMYGGYPSCPYICLYHPYSIVKYLTSDKRGLQGYWANTDTICSFKDAFKNKDIRGILYKLLDTHGGIEELLCEACTWCKCACGNNNSVSSSSHRFQPICAELLGLLVAQGYLVYRPYFAIPALVIPNEEVKRLFIKQLVELYIETYKINDTKLHSCTYSFTKLLESIGKSADELILALQDFHKKHQDFISDVVASNLDKVNNAILKQICFVPLLKAGVQLEFKDVSEEKSSVTVDCYNKYLVKFMIMHEGENDRANDSKILECLMESYRTYKNVILINSVVNAETKSFSVFTCSKHNTF